MDYEEQEEHEEEEEMEIIRQPYESEGRVKISTSSEQAVVTGGALTTATVAKPRYRECLKNHAVGIGGHAVDGCGEFMAAGTEGTLDALKCAACNCHRNFHRKELFDTPLAPPHGGGSGGELYFHHPHLHHQVPQFAAYYRTPGGYLHMAPPRPLALPSTSGGGQSREFDQEDVSNPSGGLFGGSGGGSSRKRFRTKFSQDQKDNMLALAERLGWRIQKHDEATVQQFCNETGVKRHVLKVWMHNNKHTLGKKP